MSRVRQALTKAKHLCPPPRAGEIDIIRASGLPMGAVLREAPPAPIPAQKPTRVVKRVHPCPELVAAIRAAPASMSLVEVARLYHVGRTTVYMIRKGRR